MTLEAAIQENTSAIRELIAAISKGIPTTTAQVAAVVAEAPQASAPTKEPEAPAKPEPAAPAASQATSAPAPAASAPAPSYEDVKHAIVKLSGSKGRDAVVTLLKDFGAGKGPDLKPEQFGDFIAKAQQLVAALVRQGAHHV